MLCSLECNSESWQLEYHSLLLTQTMHYITPNHHAVQVSIARGMGRNADYRNGSQADKVLFHNKLISTCIKFCADFYVKRVIGYTGTPSMCLLGGVWLTHDKYNTTGTDRQKITCWAAFIWPNHKVWQSTDTLSLLMILLPLLFNM